MNQSCQSCQSWLSAIFEPRAFLYIGRPWINRLAVSAVFIQSVYYVIDSFVCLFFPSLFRSFVSLLSQPSICFLSSALLVFPCRWSIPRWRAPVCACRAFLKNSSSFISIDRRLFQRSSLFPFLPQSTSSARWSFIGHSATKRN